MIHFCTLFDKNYASKGLALYHSLMATTKEEIILHVLALDDETFHALIKIPLPHMMVRRLSDIKDDWEIQQAINRPWPYFCFSMASIWTQIIAKEQRVIEWEDEERGEYRPSPHWIGYIDADCYFFGDINIPIQELEERSKYVGIIPHRFPPHDHDRLIPNGRYNVSLVLFKGREGMEVLDWWTNKCIEKCDETTVGDQKYLDLFHSLTISLNWPDPVYDIDHPGVGMGPWNICKYTFAHEGNRLVCNEGHNTFWMVFYHYHEFKKLQDGQYRLTNYPLSEEDRAFVYRPYVTAIMAAEKELENAGLHVN